MTRLPRYVCAQTSRGRTYYYFNAAEMPGDRKLVRLPDIADPAFEGTVAALAAKKPAAAHAPSGTAPPPPLKRYVYFIGGDTGAIKIGFTVNPEKRLREVQTASAFELRLLAVIEGGATVERQYHERFGPLRLKGEWFERHPLLMAEIERLNGTESEARTNHERQNAFQNGLGA